MTPQATDYKKFSGKKRSLIGTDRIWFGQDHLLIVESTGVSERYKRFFFKDIQAVRLIQAKKSIGKYVFLAALFLAAGFLGVWAWNSRIQELAFFPAAAFLFLLYYLIRMVIKGPLCECWIYSSVQREKIKPVTTLKTGKKLLELLIPEIKAAQGTLPAENTAEERVTAKPSAILKHAVPEPLKKIPPAWHRISFLLLMVYGIFLTLILRVHPPGMIIAASVLGLLVLTLSIIAVVKQTGSDFSRPLKTVSVTALIFLILGSISGYFEYMFFYMINLEKWAVVSHNQWETIKLIAEIDYFDYPVLIGKEIFLISVYFCLGAAGLLYLRKQEK